MKNSLQKPVPLALKSADAASAGNKTGEIIATAIALSAMLAIITPYPKATMTSGVNTRAPSRAAIICEADSIPRTYIHSSGEA